jgi:hypothetical protein
MQSRRRLRLQDIKLSLLLVLVCSVLSFSVRAQGFAKEDFLIGSAIKGKFVFDPDQSLVSCDKKVKARIETRYFNHEKTLRGSGVMFHNLIKPASVSAKPSSLFEGMAKTKWTLFTESSSKLEVTLSPYLWFNEAEVPCWRLGSGNWLEFEQSPAEVWENTKFVIAIRSSLAHPFRLIAPRQKALHSWRAEDAVSEHQGEIKQMLSSIPELAQMASTVNFNDVVVNDLHQFNAGLDGANHQFVSVRVSSTSGKETSIMIDQTAKAVCLFKHDTGSGFFQLSALLSSSQSPTDWWVLSQTGLGGTVFSIVQPLRSENKCILQTIMQTAYASN